MIEKRYIELMNSEIDGVNSPEESRELHEYLDGAPDARRHFEELKSVGRALSEAEEVSPPPTLRGDIMRAVEGRRRAEAGSSSTRRRRRAVRISPRLTPAYAFAGGMAAGLFLFALISVTLPDLAPGDSAHLFGTIGGERCTVDAPVMFDVPGASGNATVRYCAETVTVELSLSSESEVLVVLSYDDEVDFDGWRALQSGDHAINVAGHRAELTHSGDRDYDLYFTDYTESHMPLRMSILSGGRSVFESSVPPGR